MIAHILARAQNGVIGLNNTLPWKLKTDFARFKALTLGHPIVMGRKTFDSLGRTLPGRTHYIISRSKLSLPASCLGFQSVEEALQAAQLESDQVFIIGGSEIYSLSSLLVDTLYITEIHADVVGDAYYTMPEGDWQEISREKMFKDEFNDFDFDFVMYKRKMF